MLSVRAAGMLNPYQANIYKRLRHRDCEPRNVTGIGQGRRRFRCPGHGVEFFDGVLPVNITAVAGIVTAVGVVVGVVLRL